MRKPRDFDAKLKTLDVTSLHAEAAANTALSFVFVVYLGAGLAEKGARWQTRGQCRGSWLGSAVWAA